MPRTTSFLHLFLPLARLYGRIRHGLTPWRCRAPARSRLPRRWSMAIWSECWHEPAAWVQQVRDAIGCGGARVNDGGPYDRWDLEVAGGALARARLLIAVEDHGAGTQYVRFGIRPKCSGAGLAAITFFAAVAGAAATSAAWTGPEKPDPAIFDLALRHAGCAASEPVMIGDRLDNDIRPARLLGWRTMRVLQGPGRFQSPRDSWDEPDPTVANVTLIPPALIGRIQNCEIGL